MSVTTADAGTVTADSLFITASGAPATTLTSQDVANIAAAVLAALMGASIPVNVTQIKGQTISGSGRENDPWGP